MALWGLLCFAFVFDKQFLEHSLKKITDTIKILIITEILNSSLC